MEKTTTKFLLFDITDWDSGFICINMAGALIGSIANIIMISEQFDEPPEIRFSKYYKDNELQFQNKQLNVLRIYWLISRVMLGGITGLVFSTFF